MSIDMSRYVGLFVSEATEHLEALGRELLQLEKGGSPETIDSLFRHAHSLKGMSASMGFEPCAVLAHRLEDVLDVLRKDSSVMNPGLLDLMLSAADALNRHVRCVAEGRPVEDIPAVSQALHEALERLTGLPPPSTKVAVTSESTRSPGAPWVRLRFQVARTCKTPGVRAFLAYKRLSGAGKIVELKPPLEAVKAGKLPDGQVTVLLEGGKTPEELQALFRGLVDLELLECAVESPPSTAAPPSVVGREPARTLRVKTELLDEFLETVGELLLATARIREVNKALPPMARAQVDEASERIFRLTRSLHDKVMTARMTPMTLITDRLPRAARDIARHRGKSVELQVLGAELELDRSLIDELADPLLHLLRNAVDHGLEMPAQRLAQGKPETGKVTVTIRRLRDTVSLLLEDDGRGMDAEALRRAAVARGAISEQAAKGLSDEEAFLLCCLPGVSTSADVTDVSGRGVGMDAVKNTVERVGGRLSISSTQGQGTRFELTLPLSVAVLPVLLVDVGQESYGLPIQRVLAVTTADASRLQRVAGQSHLSYGGELLPAYHLAECLKVPSPPRIGSRPFVIVEAASGKVALSVDRLRGQQEAVLKSLSKPLSLVPGLGGVTLLGNGRPVFILDVQRLLAA